MVRALPETKDAMPPEVVTFRDIKGLAAMKPLTAKLLHVNVPVRVGFSEFAFKFKADVVDTCWDEFAVSISVLV
jgi:hypothetical protein